MDANDPILISKVRDKEGRPIAYLRVKIYKSFPKFSDYFKQFFIHIINNIDTQREENGWAMVWDLTGAGPSNWDLSMIRFVISSFRLYFPKGMQYLVIYGVPWIMTAFVNIGMKLLSEEARNKVIFASKDQIFSHIDPSNVPDFMGGKCEQNYRDVPKEVVRDCRDLGAERGINSDEIESVLKFIDKNNNFPPIKSGRLSGATKLNNRTSFETNLILPLISFGVKVSSNLIRVLIKGKLLNNLSLAYMITLPALSTVYGKYAPNL
ncbi:unnamed protein product [Oppiella nova]|uniref:CRAL-TRIO domain-containing protein n=1 Tax=Oppiella nova TaxID=334625 RepID=A0A7R9QMT1_9ACAR|nr:unnamed protein product [Oppiella nova]CAG2168704.1 unnamed protein product [Oppiella nova]